VVNAPAAAQVDFILDGATTITDTTAPYSATFTNIVQGNHTIEARLIDTNDTLIDSDLNSVIGSEGDNYLTIGDSITSGREDNYITDNTSEDGRNLSFQGFHALLNDLLTQSLSIPHIVVDEGVGADDTDGALNLRLDSILARNPDSNRVLVLLGTNDADTSLPVPSGLGCNGTACNGTYKGNMQSIIDGINNAGKSAFIAQVPPSFGSTSISTPFPDPLNTTRNDIIQEYNEVIRNELNNRNLGPDLFACFLGANNRYSLFTDNFHPNGLGYAVISQLWHDVLTGARLPSDPCTTIPRFILENLSDSTTAPFNKQNLIEEGDAYYVDRGITITNIPNGLGLEDGVWIMTAESDRTNSSNNYLSFDVDRDVTLFVAYDNRAISLPNWLSGFTDTSAQIENSPNSHNFNVFSSNFTSGTITLGGNLAAGANGALANYIVIVVPQ